MAKKRRSQNTRAASRPTSRASKQTTSQSDLQRTDKQLIEDIQDYHLEDTVWTHARNAITNSVSGDMGSIGNEPSNEFCAAAPYAIIGTIHIQGDRWAIFSTDDSNSEIGLFDESACTYTTIVNDDCLAFNRNNLITGISRENFDCNWNVYWADGNNPDRIISIDIDNPSNNEYTSDVTQIPWIQECEYVDDCYICENTPALDCDKIRLEELIEPLCFRVEKGKSGGELLNGSYYVVGKYVVDDQEIGDFSIPSNIQPLFNHNNTGSSLDIFVEFADERFDEFKLVLIAFFAGQTIAVEVGIYSTRQKKITLDFYDNRWPAVPGGLNAIPIRTPVANKSDAIFRNGNYAIRVGPTTKFDFNYQPLANQIVSKWVSVEYPENYYHAGGNHTGYMRDEVYTFFIRFVYDTGDKSASYHIPGRPQFISTVNQPVWSNPYSGTPTLESGTDLSDYVPSVDSAPTNWIVHNTAVWDGIASAAYPQPAEDGIGNIIAEGYMGYWESSEIYDDDRPEIWNANTNSAPYANTDVLSYNLCGKPIRHHKFPDNSVHPNVEHFNCGPNDFIDNPCTVRILGVKFDNILPPVYNPQDPPAQWIPIPGITGYEILRGTRVGNESIVAKGIINNMFRYELRPEGNERSNTNITAGKEFGLYPNYPYNDLGPDPYVVDVISNFDPLFSGDAPDDSVSGIGDDGGGDFSSQDPSTTSEEGLGAYSFDADNQRAVYTNNIFSFHSPNTQYTDPFLGMEEMKVYGEVAGSVEGTFVEPNKHPKHKLITDITFFVGVLAGVGYALSQMTPKRTKQMKSPRRFRWATGRGSVSSTALTPGGNVTPNGPASIAPGTVTYVGNIGPLPSSFTATSPGGLLARQINQTYPLVSPTAGVHGNQTTGDNAAQTAIDQYTGDNAALLDALIATNTATTLWEELAYARSNWLNYIGSETNYTFTDTDVSALPQWMGIMMNVNTLYTYFVDGINTLIDLVRAFSRYQQYGLQYQSHCKYTVWNNPHQGNRRHALEEGRYINPQLTDFDEYKINNLYRNRHVALKVEGDVDPPYANVDNSKFTIGDYNANIAGTTDFSSPTSATIEEINYKEPFAGTVSKATSHYVGLKRRLVNQYGQINSIVQVTVSTCLTKLEDRSTGLLFGGDTYIGRHTEKNTMPFFANYLYGEPNGTAFNYKLNQMLPHIAYWMDSRLFEWTDFIQSIGTAFSNIGPASSANGNGFFNSLVTPSDLHCLDRGGNTGFFILKNAYFYLFNSGVRDFFVESTYNVDLRDWGDQENQRHYDPHGSFTDLATLFNTDYIKADNIYRYDSNLGINKIFNNYIQWGKVQPRRYDPYNAETCYQYRDKRMIYSLPQNQTDLVRDNWRTFLPNNYKDFVSRPVVVKPIFTSGAIILFENESPVLFKGVEELQTESLTKITIGDAGLFKQPMQNMSNSETFYEYGSCQNRRACVNTPYGTYYMSQNQGKIFIVVGNGIKEITAPGQLKWWFSTYLPYQLTDQYPDFELVDNPVIGIGCQAIYDNENMIAYFCKKDYVIRKGINPDDVRYAGGNLFTIRNTALTVELGDPRYFEDASWTVSYDVKKESWIGWHDWHPELLMGGKVNFMTVKEDGIWIHNKLCNSYCNFYGVDYPFEVELPAHAILNVGTLRSVEYQLEAYKYDDNCYDRFHVLDFNFDEAVIYNSEQCSGLLKLNLSPKNNAPQIMNYPIINIDSIDILYSKEEQKYRFNQFWDITNDRGEFTNAEEMIWNTQPNGYVRILNPNNLNYNKFETERKKFRHYKNLVFLKQTVSGNRKMLLLLNRVKNLISSR